MYERLPQRECSISGTTAPQTFSNITESIIQSGKNLLLVLDDLWETEHEKLLNFIDDTTDSKVLVSSRVRGVLEGAEIIDVGLPTEDEAVQMLLSVAGLPLDAAHLQLGHGVDGVVTVFFVALAVVGAGASGTMHLYQHDAGVLIDGTITGLAPHSRHGLSIQTYSGGNGVIFNPFHARHSCPEDGKRRVGDLGNVDGLLRDAAGALDVRVREGAGHEQQPLVSVQLGRDVAVVEGLGHPGLVGVGYARAGLVLCRGAVDVD